MFAYRVALFRGVHHRIEHLIGQGLLRISRIRAMGGRELPEYGAKRGLQSRKTLFSARKCMVLSRFSCLWGGDQLLAASFQLLACGSEGWGSVVSHPSHKYKDVARVGHPPCVGEPRMGTRQPVAGISALPGKGRLRSEVSQVPKCEAPGAPIFYGCTHCSRHLGHPPPGLCCPETGE